MDNKTLFDMHGFLAVDSLGVRQHIHETYEPYIKEYLTLNSVAWSLQQNLEVKSGDASSCWPFALYARLLNFTQAAYILAVTGLREQAQTQIRCSLEVLFKLGATNKDRNFYSDYYISELQDQLSNVNSFLDSIQKDKKNKDLKTQAKSRKTEIECELLELLKRHHPALLEKYGEKEAIKKFRLPISEFANKAGLADWYLRYRLASSSIHSDAKSLEYGHFEFSADGTVQCLKNEAHIEEFDDFLLALIEIILKAIEFFCEALNLEQPEDRLNEIKINLAKLCND
jgi:hypothetical protein